MQCHTGAVPYFYGVSLLILGEIPAYCASSEKVSSAVLNFRDGNFHVV